MVLKINGRIRNEIENRLLMGQTYNQIGNLFGCTGVNVNQIYHGKRKVMHLRNISRIAEALKVNWKDLVDTSMW